MFASGILIFIGTLVAVYSVSEFIRPLRHSSPFAG
jgi:hypothetical protein